MAIKSRLLSKLKSTYVTMNMAATSHPQKMHPVLHNLMEAKSLCQQGLTEENFAKYGEVYDGLIMAIRQIISGEAGKEAGEIVGLCKELLEHIVLETGKEEHFKKEMVFLPYKASMWDSLESVWRAAYEDKERCLAYVIPIPYCDRNPDGTAKEWHCERDLFPKDVPTLDWQEVDLKHMHPDVIFYHYPYDNRNRVTSVDSRFYSDKLKKYTDKLVYVPYFVLEEPKFDYDDPEKGEEVVEAENKMANYILEPGVTNANLIIVQSEAMKKVYVNVLTRFTNASREYWEEHIFGIGSPKFDKVLGSKKKDFEIPEEWEKLIAGRKTILYNTGLTAMLAHTDKFLKKIKFVIETFKAQDELVLWWRPHPLLISTFESMHPELLEEYLAIVREYRQEGWGIYDDTPDMDRAIACTDGYYGDWSSLVHIYEKAGKVIMIQNIESDRSCLDFPTLSDTVEMLSERVGQKNEKLYYSLKEEQENILYTVKYIKIQFSTNLLEDIKTILEIEKNFREPLHKVRYGNLLLRSMVEQIIEFRYLIKNPGKIEEYYGVNKEIEQKDNSEIKELSISEYVKLYKNLIESRYNNKKRKNVKDMADSINESKTEDDSNRLSLYDLYIILSTEMHNAYFMSDLYMVDTIEFSDYDYSKELSIQKMWLNMMIFAFMEDYEREDNE